jgi:predicted  nucleic acid-binding Zn-ribbon protein
LQEELDHRLARLDAEKKEVQMELAKVRNELARVREDASEDAKRYNGLADELKRTEEKLEDVQRDLNRERKKVR